MCAVLQATGLLVVAADATADTATELASGPAEGGTMVTAPADPSAPAPQPAPATSTTSTPATTTTTNPPPPASAPQSAPSPQPQPQSSAPQPAPAPEPAPAQAAAPAPAPPPPPPAQSALERVEQRHRAVVPSAWRAAIPVRFEIVGGSTSWAWADGRIQISQTHANASASYLGVVITHEFGHLIAFRYGSGDYNGAAPAGWPAATSNPAEHWADCVQQVFTGTSSPSHGLPPCGGAQLAWARQYLTAGPPAG